MTESAADEQDLARALDSVAAANASLGGAPTGTGVDLPQIIPQGAPAVPVASPVTVTAPTYPTITSIHTSSSPAPSNDDPTRAYTPQPHVVAPPAVVPPAPEPSTLPTPDPSPTPVITVDDAKVLNTDITLTGPLADIKKEALGELRPLVDKLSVSAEEKFDTYLLLIRSTDDEKLIGPAHEAAKAITDEARRAEALLDIIKEIDYLSRQK